MRAKNEREFAREVAPGTESRVHCAGAAGRNMLASLPLSVSQLTMLTSLKLSKNRFEAVPLQVPLPLPALARP